MFEKLKHIKNHFKAEKQQQLVVSEMRTMQNDEKWRAEVAEFNQELEVLIKKYPRLALMAQTVITGSTVESGVIIVPRPQHSNIIKPYT